VSVVGGEFLLPVVGVQQLHPDVGLVEPFLPRVAEDLLDLGRHEEGAALVVGAHLVHDRGHLIDEGAVARLRPAQVARRLALGRDVE
jgi:hypothetical protein